MFLRLGYILIVLGLINMVLGTAFIGLYGLKGLLPLVLGIGLICIGNYYNWKIRQDRED